MGQKALRGDCSSHGNWVTIRREEWPFCAPVSTPGWDSWMHVSLTRYKTLVPQLRNRGRNFIGRSRPFLTRAVSRDWQLSLSFSLRRGPKAHGLKLTSARSIYPREGKKGGQGKNPLLLDVRSPPPTVTYCTVYKAFPSGERNSRLFFSFFLFLFFRHRRDYSPALLYKLESRWGYKILFRSFRFFFFFLTKIRKLEDLEGNQRLLLDLNRDVANPLVSRKISANNLPLLPFLHLFQR